MSACIRWNGSPLLCVNAHQQIISVLALQSRKFCAFTLVCHHFLVFFGALIFLIWSLQNLIVHMTAALLSSRSTSLSLSALYLACLLSLSLSHWTDSQYTAATGSDQRVGAASVIKKCAVDSPHGPALACESVCDSMCKTLCSHVWFVQDCVCVCVCLCEWMCSSSSKSSSSTQQCGPGD